MTELKDAGPRANGARLGLILLACCVGQFMVVLDASIVNVALDPIQHSLDLSPDSLQWVINAYTIVFAGFLLLGGRLADLFGRRKVYVSGLLLFTVTSLIAGVAGNAEWLLIARGLQGLGGAILAPATLTIIFTSFSDWTSKAKALGTWGAVAAAGGAVGALLGGVLTHYVSWRWVFLVNVPIGIALITLIFAVIPETRNENADRRIDTVGAVAITGGLMAIVYGVVEANSKGWSSATTIVSLVVGAGLVLFFVLNEAKFAKNPLVPLSIFTNRSVSAANIVSLTTSASLVGVLFLLTLQMQFVFGWDSLKTGLSYVPMSLAILVLARGVAPRLTQKIGPGPVLVIGGLLATAGLIWLAFGTHGGDFAKDLLGPTVLYGAGSGMTTATVTVAGTTNVPYTQAGLVSGLLNASRQVGGALWLGIMAAILAAFPASLIPSGASIDGYHRVYLIAAALPLIGAVAGMFVPKKKEDPSAAQWSASSSKTTEAPAKADAVMSKTGSRDVPAKTG